MTNIDIILYIHGTQQYMELLDVRATVDGLLKPCQGALRKNLGVGVGTVRTCLTNTLPPISQQNDSTRC